MLQIMVFLVTAADAAAETPNFVMILADDQGWGDVGYNPHAYQNKAYEYEWKFNPPQTPHLDAMAASDNSIVFWRWYSGAPVSAFCRSVYVPSENSPKQGLLAHSCVHSVWTDARQRMHRCGRRLRH